MYLQYIKKFLGKIRRIVNKNYGTSITKKDLPALNGIDLKLEKYMNYDRGFFVEVGANDGYSQSNTYYFENHKGWQGILVEGIPELYERCKKLREKSIVFNCALVSNDYPHKHIRMHYANLMSIVKGAKGDIKLETEYIRYGLKIQKIDKTYSILVPTRTLTSIFDECKVKNIDLLSLDVEGYELEVLKGLDLQRYRPKFMCIEAWQRKRIEDYISHYYKVVEELTERDILYEAVNNDNLL